MCKKYNCDCLLNMLLITILLSITVLHLAKCCPYCVVNFVMYFTLMCFLKLRTATTNSHKLHSALPLLHKKYDHLQQLNFILACTISYARKIITHLEIRRVSQTDPAFQIWLLFDYFQTLSI